MRTSAPRLVVRGPDKCRRQCHGDRPDNRVFDYDGVRACRKAVLDDLRLAVPCAVNDGLGFRHRLACLWIGEHTGEGGFRRNQHSGLAHDMYRRGRLICSDDGELLAVAR